MRAYWWVEKPNFGDMLTPYILDRFAGITASWAPGSEAEILVTGSILHHIRPNWSGVVAGAGALRQDLPLRMHRASVVALRGPNTARLVKEQCPGVLGRGEWVLGDPGLLADELVSVETRTYDLGVLPHWTDMSLSMRPEFYSDKWKTTVIDPGLSPLDVVRQIGECKKLVTSSLHGLVVADGFGIPRRVETCFHTAVDTMFKFHDYSASIGMPLQIGKTQLAHRGYVEARKHELYDVFEGMRNWKS